MKSKAIFLDIDGTILPSNQILSPKVKYAIEQARTNGHNVFLLPSIIDNCNISSFSNVEFEGMVCSNGAYIIINNQVIYDISIPEDDLENCLKFLDENDIEYNLETNFVSFYSQSMIDFLNNIAKVMYQNLIV